MSKLFPNAQLRDNAPYRFDIVGSFLRPESLKQARQQCSCGDISCADLSEVEDKEIANLVAKQKAVGLPAVTDGEFRRTFWHLDFLSALEGVEEVEAEKFSVQFKHHNVRPKTLKIVDKIGFSDHHPFLEHYRSLQQIAGDYPVKFTIPSPSMLHLICTVRETAYHPIERYKNNNQQLLDDIAEAYIRAMQKFYALGCRNLQLDDTSWGELCSEEKRQAYQARGFDLEQLAKDYVYMVNRIIAVKPEDMTITMHICRGNFRSTWFSSGGYEPVAEILFGNCNVDGFFLEYDSDRSGDFKPLRFIKDQQVVLGLITSKDGNLEDKNEIIKRIQEAAQYVDINQLCLSPQCGFASTEEGNILTEEQQWNKLDFIREIVEEVWGKA
ncbi:5-methyltetrahydropteroyltriglutamate--homocysteine S-methyltransferase [Avibacterium sp. 20-15]|uniref:5-methyltetrahydropteroyltriglutamate-- homocysteine S-methyltransferase n=1 Tax=unclassified Avibacterium TaxID=2685287 RepID=UPI002025C041|nr:MULTISPECIES: 5-methyltetrahydropteroyltriglutamate--homocysteine S-methyltransferase [unclassified Avibacterium]MCW9733498.1 5-methyltetrahydropteroyltriglutamate--homocysteine S-methyltransferase [Avibacterium sp. 20-15]URL03361.1 5-methyltetrahydropteroyltriglutamate--homocysteine S-methyltransferase [Avibacterium sp. 20-132]